MPAYEESGIENFMLGEYDPDKIYAKAYNQYGTGAADIRVAVSRGIVAAMHELTSRKDIPYRNMADFVRDAIVHRLHYWHGKSEDEVFDPVALRIAEAEAETALVQQFESLVKMREEQYRQARGSYRDEIARQVRLDLSEIPDRFDWIREALNRLT